MARYRSYGSLDDVPVDDGDVGFRGVNLRLPAWQLQPGMLSISENGRIDGEWVPRRGVDIVTEGSLASGVPLRLPFWLIDDNSGAAEGSQGLAVSAAERDGELVTLTVTGHGLPVGGSAASVIVDPAGADNSILFTAVDVGVSGTQISVEYVESPVDAPLAVTVDDSAISVNITAGESGGVLANNTIRFSTTSNINWYEGGNSTFTNEDYVYVGGNEWQRSATERIYFESGYWYLEQASFFFDSTAILRAAGTLLDDPSSLTYDHAPDSEGYGGSWTLTPISGTFDGTTTAADVIAAVNADPVASLLVTASASGTVSGAVAAVGPVFLQGGSDGIPAHLCLEGVTGPTEDPNGAWLMTPTDADTLEFTIENAAPGTESYTVTTARVLSELADFATGDVLGACLFSDPSSDDAESVFLAYGNEVWRVLLSTGAVTTLTLPGSETIDGRVEMIQAMDKVLLFRAGKIALEWIRGAAGFTAVASGPYTQPVFFSSSGSGIAIASGLVEFTVTGNTTIAEGDVIFIYSATDTRFSGVVGNSYQVASITGTTKIRCYIPLTDSSSGSNAVVIGKAVSIGGGFIHQPGFPWAVYFQRRLWGPYEYRWDTGLSPDAFSARNIHDELVASDILDTDTYDPIENQFRITSGVADRLVALHPFFNDTLLVLMRNSLHSVAGTVGSLLDCTVNELTREIGCLARKSVVTQGNAVFFLSDNGVYGLSFADQYNLRGIDRPLSEAIQPYIDRISKDLAHNSVAAYFDNRYWLAVPLDSEPRAGDAVGNNVIFVYNLLNGEWESVDTFGDPAFLITDFIIATAGGRNDLHAVTSAGGIHVLDKLDEDYDNIATNPSAGATQRPVAWSFQSRGYTCGTTDRKRFSELGIQMKSGTAQSDAGVIFATDDPDNIGAEMLASASLGGPLAAGNSADVRQRVGGLRGFNGIVSLTPEIGRPRIRGVKVSGTVAARATLTQK